MTILDPDVYDKAADIVEKHGLSKGLYRDENGCYCVAGAIMAAIDGEFPRYEPAVFPARWAEYTDAFRWNLGIPSVTRWNDHPDRTAEEVVNALRGTCRAVRGANRGVAK